MIKQTKLKWFKNTKLVANNGYHFNFVLGTQFSTISSRQGVQDPAQFSCSLSNALEILYFLFTSLNLSKIILVTKVNLDLNVLKCRFCEPLESVSTLTVSNVKFVTGNLMECNLQLTTLTKSTALRITIGIEDVLEGLQANNNYCCNDCDQFGLAICLKLRSIHFH